MGYARFRKRRVCVNFRLLGLASKSNTIQIHSMQNISNARRQFLKLMAQAGSASAALSAIPDSIAKALAIEPLRDGSDASHNNGSILDVEHVLIFMQENRSFDHYFGMLKGVRGWGDPRPFSTRSGKPVWQQPVGDGTWQFPFPLAGVTGNIQALFDRSQCLADDLPHDWKYSQKMWAHYDVWVKEKSKISMGYLSRQELPFYYALADAFTVGDAYHASLFGPTDPNRMFLFSGTNGVSVDQDGRHALSNVDDGNETACMSRDKKDWKSPYQWTTYAERLSAHKISWKVYQEYDNYGDNSLAYFPQFRGLDLNNPEQAERYRRARAYAGETSQVDAKGLPLNTNPPYAQALVDAFRRDVQTGELPAVSWIVAPTAMTEHPEKNPPGFGESLCARLLDALTENPSVWAKSVFILCYDEEGGFFDHVPPPCPPTSRHDGYSTVSTFGETSAGESFGLGPRLPFIVASPWTRGGFVCSETFDHTSIIRFLEKRFGVLEPNISSWRREVCGDLCSMFDFTRKDSQRPQTLFNTVDTSHQAAIDRAQKACLGEKSKEALKYNFPPLAERNLDTIGGTTSIFGDTRPARALDYRHEVNLKNNTEQTERKAINLRFDNTGNKTIAYRVSAKSHNIGMWYYTIGAQQSFSETWFLRDFANERYHLRVDGPNGFMRIFQGQGLQKLEVDVSNLATRDTQASQVTALKINLRNRGEASCSLKLKDNFYGAPEQTIALAAGEEKTIFWSTDASFGWYDFSITTSNDKNALLASLAATPQAPPQTQQQSPLQHFLQRYAGHLENAQASRSDPANGKFYLASDNKSAPKV